MVIPNALPLNYGLTIGLVTSVVIHRISEFLHQQKGIYPKNVLAADNEYYYWRYRNFFVSIVHAALTGIGSLLCVIHTPYLLIDVIDTYTEAGFLLTSFSLGYFIYDTYEMLTHANYKGTVELVIHHVLIILCFSNTIIFRRYIGYNMIALLIENSNIFLHFRQLLLLSNYPKSGSYYQTNCVLNIVLFVLIRGSCMLWLWYTLIANLSIIPWITKSIALSAMFGISITTVILFKRVFNSDFVLENGRISRKLTRPKVEAHTNDESVHSEKLASSEPDLYEPMVDSFGNQDEQQTESSSTNSTISPSTYSLRKRLNGADHMAATTAAAAVNN